MSTALAIAPDPEAENPVNLGLPPNWKYDARLIPLLPDKLDYRLYNFITGTMERYAICVTADPHVWDVEKSRRVAASPDKGTKKRKGTGRLRVRLYPNPFLGGRKHYLSRLVCAAVYGAPPSDKHEADHIDKCVTNNAWDNLQWVVGDTNRKLDRIRNAPPRKRRANTQKTGSDNSNSKISKLEELLKDAAGYDSVYKNKRPLTERQLAEKYGISHAQIHRILTGQSRREEVEELCRYPHMKHLLPKKFRKT